MLIPRSALLLLAFSVLGVSSSYAATLNFSATAEEISLLSLTDAPGQSCIDSAGGGQFPFSCERDSNGGHVISHIGGSSTANGMLSAPYIFQGSGTAAIFPQPGADTKSVYASYTFQAVLSPLTSGNVFRFMLSDVNTCSNSLGACVTENVSVSGAKSIRGRLSKGEIITANQPVIVNLTEAVSVSNVSSRWTETVGSTLDITPLSETSGKGGKSHLIEASANPAVAPEPGTLGLLSLALAAGGLAAAKRTRFLSR